MQIIEKKIWNILFSGKNQKKNISLSSAEFAHSKESIYPCPAEPGYALLQTV